MCLVYLAVLGTVFKNKLLKMREISIEDYHWGYYYFIHDLLNTKVKRQNKSWEKNQRTKIYQF